MRTFITKVEAKVITKKNGTTKKIIAVYLSGRATDAQKLYFSNHGFRYYPAQVDWANIDGRWVKVGYKSAGSYYADYNEALYNELAKCVVRTAPAAPAPQPEKAKKPTPKQAALDKLGKALTLNEINAILDAVAAK